MTADERIEKLLNHFGQTIADLPKADGMHYVYDYSHRKMAEKTAYKWHKVIGQYFDTIVSVRMINSYICHLADVIDRMEAALETATRWYPCECCGYGFTDDYWKKRCPCYKNEEYEESGFRIADKLLVDEQEE